MLSRSAIRWLLEKEWRELLASRAWWVLLAAMGPLVGVSFISAVRAYGELSGVGGTAAGVGEAFSPLIGIWAPTFSACELAAAFLLPFVAIRVMSADRQTGTLKLELQHHTPALARVAVKAVVLAAGWTIASIPAFLGVALWKIYGGTLYAPELLTVILGHMLNAGLTIALAAAASMLTEHPSTAAILTLAVTVGTWVLNFIAAVQGGVWERAAGYTPTAMVAAFQHGLVRLDIVLIAAALVAAGLSFAAIWTRLGIAFSRRCRESALLAAAAVAVVLGCTLASASWDFSEDRRNSFAREDEAALRTIRQPLRIEAHLAPEDPRRFDLEHRAFDKLRRTLPRVQVEYRSATTVGLFEQTAAQYGEVWYELGGRRVMSRGTTADDVLATIYAIADIAPPAVRGDEIFRGHPLAARPRGAATIFYGIWPAAVVAAALFLQSLQWRQS